MLKKIRNGLHGNYPVGIVLDRAVVAAIAGGSFAIIVEALGSGKNVGVEALGSGPDVGGVALLVSLACASAALPLAAYVALHAGGFVVLDGGRGLPAWPYRTAVIALSLFVVAVGSLVLSLSGIAFLAFLISCLCLLISNGRQSPAPQSPETPSHPAPPAGPPAPIE